MVQFRNNLTDLIVPQHLGRWEEIRGLSEKIPTTIVGKIFDKVFSFPGPLIEAVGSLLPKSERSAKTVGGGFALFVCVVCPAVFYFESCRVGSIAYIGLFILIGREFYIKATQGDV